MQVGLPSNLSHLPVAKRKEKKMEPADSVGRYAIREGNDRMASHRKPWSLFGAAVAAVACAILLSAQSAVALEISFRSFSGSAAIGPPADDYAAKLSTLSTTVLGETGAVKFSKYKPTPAIPEGLKNIVAAVGAGGPLAGEQVSTPHIFQGRTSTRHGGLFTIREFPSGPTLMST